MKLLGLVIAITACAPDSQPQGNANTRVVTLVPAATEIIEVLGLGAAIVGRAEEDSGRTVSHLPSAGRVLAPNTERIVELRPDLVIAWPGAESLLQRLRASGVRTLAARFERVHDVAPNIRSIGLLLGVPDKADSLADRITEEIGNLREKQARGHRPRVLYLLDTDPFWTAGSNTFVDDLIEIAGGTNLFGDLPTPWSEVSLEAVVQRQPDVIIVAQPRHQNARDWLAQPGWRALRAVERNRVYFVDADVFNRPGPNIVLSARQLALLLHSEQQ